MVGTVRSVWIRALDLGAGRHPLEGGRLAATAPAVPHLQPHHDPRNLQALEALQSSACK